MLLEGDVGKYVFAEIEVQNSTKWPWKRGCYVGLNCDEHECPLKVKVVPIDFDVKGMQTFKL